MTYEEIIARLQKIVDTKNQQKKKKKDSDLTLHEFLINLMDYGNKVIAEADLGPINEVLREGGTCEGMTFSVVRHFVMYDVYIRLDIFHTDNNKTMDKHINIRQVVPFKKVVTDYQ
jgi:hypothetical protein